MEFDRFTLAFLLLRPDAPNLGGKKEDALQDAHLSFLTRLREEGHLLVAGPSRSEEQPEVRGACIYKDPPNEAKRRAEKDPAVRAGKYSIRVFQWTVPSGTISFPQRRMPRSMAEARG
jgi:uncharacterized protein